VDKDGLVKMASMLHDPFMFVSGFLRFFFSKKKKTYQNGFCFFISDAGMAGSGGVILLIVQCTDNRSDLFTVQIIVVVLLKSNS